MVQICQKFPILTGTCGSARADSAAAAQGEITLSDEYTQSDDGTIEEIPILNAATHRPREGVIIAAGEPFRLAVAKHVEFEYSALKEASGIMRLIVVYGPMSGTGIVGKLLHRLFSPTDDLLKHISLEANESVARPEPFTRYAREQALEEFRAIVESDMTDRALEHNMVPGGLVVHLDALGLDPALVAEISNAGRIDSNLAFTGSGADLMVRCIRIAWLAYNTFGNREKTRAWLTRPSHAFRNQAPYRLLASEAGGRLLENHLNRIRHGIAA